MSYILRVLAFSSLVLSLDVGAVSKEAIVSFVYDGVGLGLSVDHIESNLSELGYARSRETVNSVTFEKPHASDPRRSDEVVVNFRDDAVTQIRISTTSGNIDVASEKSVFVDALGEPDQPCSDRGGQIRCTWRDDSRGGTDISAALHKGGKQISFRRGR